MIIRVIGRNRTPASNGVYPRICCRYRLMNRKIENIPSETENATVLPAENAGIRKNDSGIIAFGLRCSHQKNAPRSTAEAVSEPTITGSDHPFWFASIRP